MPGAEVHSTGLQLEEEAAGRLGLSAVAAVEFVAKLRASLKETGWSRLRVFQDPSAHPLEDLETALVKISKALGCMVPQSHRGNLVAYIRNEGHDYRSHMARGHQTNAELSFHSDRCDLNLLLYVSTAAEGGELSVVSYEAVSEALRNENEDAWRTLFAGFPFDLREERIFSSLAWHWRPILWQTPAGVRGHYIRRFITDSQRHADAPRLTQPQLDALDAFDAVLSGLRPNHTFAPVAGELLALDNYRVMHARRAYVDGASGSERLALRTWVAPFASEPLPIFLHPIAGACEAGVYRGGVGLGPEYNARLGQSLIHPNP
jgi:hypothetical protein